MVETQCGSGSDRKAYCEGWRGSMRYAGSVWSAGFFFQIFWACDHVPSMTQMVGGGSRPASSRMSRAPGAG